MKRFAICAKATINTFTIVEAETLDEAIGIAKERPITRQSVTLADEDGEWCISGGIDGEPKVNRDDCFEVRDPS